MPKYKAIPLITAFAVAAGILVPLAVYDNSRFETVRYSLSHRNLPAAFNGLRIVQLSDLHDNVFGEKQERLLTAIKAENPHIIVITGDLIDSEQTENAMNLVNGAVKIAPCYYANGNHEIRTGRYLSEIRPALIRWGVKVLDDEKTYLEKDGEKIAVIGLSDLCGGEEDQRRALKTLAENEAFTVLLAHRPERFKLYSDCGVSLVFSGHAHGGQFRIPFTHQGVYSPGQGLFPRYTEGVFSRKNTKMTVSRGLGNQVIIPRLNNCFELVSVTLYKA